MEHIFSSGANTTTFVLGILALLGFAWRLLRLITKGVHYLGTLADLPDIVRDLVAASQDHEARIVSLETTHRTVETVETRRTVVPPGVS